MELSSPCPQGMRARFFWMPVGLEPARGRASSGRAASAASRRGRRQATEAGADLRSKYADVPPPLPRIVYEPVSPQGCELVSSRCRWGSNPRGGERQADAQRPQRAGEGAGRRPKPVRICAANTRTSHRPYHVIACELVSLWDAGSFLLDAGGALSCGGIVPVLAAYQPI